MTNSAAHITKASAIITIITGLMMAIAWLSGRSSLPELIFGKIAEKILPVTEKTAVVDDYPMYKEYTDSLMDKQEEKHFLIVTNLQKRIDSLAGINPEPPPPPTQNNCLLENVVYQDNMGQIRFHTKKGNTYEFDGDVSGLTVNGKVIHKGNKLYVETTGYINGEMTLLNRCTELSGTLYNKEIPSIRRNVDMRKNK